MIKVNNEIVEIKRFPDGTLNIKGDSNIASCCDEVIISWHYENDAEFMAVSFLTKYYQANGCKVYLYLPYVPNGRMDRVESLDDIFTMKYFGELINSLNFEKVYVMDTHSSVSYAVIKKCSVIGSSDIVEGVISKITKIDKAPIMFYPDEGSIKRYSKIIKLPFAFGMKNRDWKTGKILGLDIFGLEPEEIKGKSILIRDDICSKGGTFYHSAKKLKELGADKIYLFVTHCENSIWDGEFGEYKQNLIETGLIDHIFTTDSIYNADSGDYSDRITVIETVLDFNPNMDFKLCNYYENINSK